MIIPASFVGFSITFDADCYPYIAAYTADADVCRSIYGRCDAGISRYCDSGPYTYCIEWAA